MGAVDPFVQWEGIVLDQEEEEADTASADLLAGSVAEGVRTVAEGEYGSRIAVDDVLHRILAEQMQDGGRVVGEWGGVAVILTADHTAYRYGDSDNGAMVVEVGDEILDSDAGDDILDAVEGARTRTLRQVEAVVANP
jgi:hypothetical protein